MKHSRILLASFLLASLFASCDKFSYREEYTGNFDFTTIRKVVGGQNPDSTNTAHPGYVKLWDKESVLIRFLEDDSLAPKISETGLLTIEGFVSSGSFSGSYSDIDNLTFQSAFRSYTGDSVEYDVTGIRR